MRLRMNTGRDDGSILLGFLAMLIVSGLLLAVLATVMSGEKQNRFDRSFERALLLAEQGHSQIASLVQSNPNLTPEQLVALAQPAFTADATGGVPGASTPYLRGTVSDGTYAVRATKTIAQQRPMTIINWKLEAEGSSSTDGRTRRIESEIEVRPTFGLAAFGKTVLNMNGDNAADSFYSTEGTGSYPQNTDICLRTSAAEYANLGTPQAGIDSSQTEVNMCDQANRGYGVVATNGRLDLQGQVPSQVDIMEVHNARERVSDPLPNAAGWCQGPAQACDNLNPSTLPSLTFYREPIELPAIKACELGAGSVPSSYGAGATFGGSVYDVQNLDLYGSTVFQGTSASPTILCVRGNLTVHSAQLVNFQNTGQLFPTGEPRYVPRRPGTLMIFMVGGSNSTVELRSNSAFSGAIYAPDHVISCGAQGNVFGSMVANDISCQGGFRFHYDQALGENLTYPAVRAQNWREIFD